MRRPGQDGHILRVVVVGARRRRQGLGAFIARFFGEAGATICGVVGTSASTAAEAREALPPEVAPACGTYTDLEHALAQERPDVVAVCSPYAAHRTSLVQCARYSCHCLCEKPLWWEESPDRRGETERLVDGFLHRNVHLALVTQWPETLGDFYRMHPEATGCPLDRFEMHLSPIGSGEAMVPEAAPHPLSMLQRLVGCGDIVDARADYFSEDRRELCLYFAYAHAGGRCAVNIRFTTCESPPRPAAYAINGRWVHRRVTLGEYSLAFESEGRRLVIGDPLGALVKKFVREVESGDYLRQRDRTRRELVHSVTALEPLLAAVRAAGGSAGVDAGAG